MTAVEWLEKELKKIPFVNPKEVFEQAKEMEKQQIIDAWKDGYGGDEHSEIEYYTSTYGSKGSDGKCPNCGAMEVDAMSPKTVYECGSSDYDQRPNTFKQSEGCKGSDETKTDKL